MKLMLAMLRPRNWEGKLIHVLQFPFLIGREPGCHLRADSSTISLRHCALLSHDDKVFVNGFEGNPTLVNGCPVQGEQEVHDQDCVKVGGLRFTIRLQSGAVRPEGEPAPTDATPTDEEAVANLLLSLDEAEGKESVSSAETMAAPHDTHRGAPGQSGSPKPRAAQPEPRDPATAARSMLAKFRRPTKPGIG